MNLFKIKLKIINIFILLLHESFAEEVDKERYLLDVGREDKCPPAPNDTCGDGSRNFLCVQEWVFY